MYSDANSFHITRDGLLVTLFMGYRGLPERVDKFSLLTGKRNHKCHRGCVVRVSSGQGSLFGDGIVAEMPCPENKSRFLVFFMNGFAKYEFSVECSGPVKRPLTNTGIDLRYETFLRLFFRTNRAVEPVKGSVRVFVDGEKREGRVVSVDGSMVMVELNDNRFWVYSGSPRIEENPVHIVSHLDTMTRLGAIYSRMQNPIDAPHQCSPKCSPIVDLERSGDFILTKCRTPFNPFHIPFRWHGLSRDKETCL